MTLAWQSKAWEEYIEWQKTDKNIAKKINELVKECLRTPTEGKRKPRDASLQFFWLLVSSYK